MTSPYHIYVTSQQIHNFLEAFFMFFQYKKRYIVFSGEQEKESIICVRMGQKNPSLVITICHHSASLVMTMGDHLVITLGFINSFNLKHTNMFWFYLKPSIWWPLFQAFQHYNFISTEKPVLSGHSKEDTKYAFKTDNHLMQVKSSAECLDLH